MFFILEILIFIFLYIIIKDLQIIKNDLSSLNIKDSSVITKSPLFNPVDMLSLFNNSLKMLNIDNKKNTLNLNDID